MKTVLAALLISIVITPKILAQSLRENLSGRLDVSAADIVQTRCPRVSERVNANISKIQKNDEIFISNLERIIDKVVKISNKYNKNIDQLLKQSNYLLKEYVETRTELVSKFEKMKQSACINDRRSFDGAMLEIVKLHRESLSKKANLVNLIKVDMINKLKLN